MPAPTPETPLSLVIEASTSRGSIALVTRDRVLADETVMMRGEHAERLLPAVARVLARSGVRVTELASVVCGAGPGSFTSLRIAAAIAKGLIEERPPRPERPLASVSSLALIIAGAAAQLEPGRYVAAADALRGERYGALIETSGGEIRPIGAWRRLEASELARWAEETEARVIGPGCPIDAWPVAAGAIRLWPMVARVDAASWEPDYGRLATAEARRAAGSLAGLGG